MNITSPYLVDPHTHVHLKHRETREDGGYKSSETAAPILVKHRNRLEELQEVLYAGQQRAVLVVLQGMDTAGKDGAIRHIFSGVNPEGCSVASFKVPTPLEARHDFLWRVHARVPPLGMIGIFNRSHYEDVLSPRVHQIITPKVVQQRLDRINDFERGLHQAGVVILKFFLHISHKEQTERLQDRIDTSDKQWKLSEADFAERTFWHDYRKAYEDILSHTSHKHAPWFIIPSDRKWYRNLAISEILVNALDSLSLSYPKPIANISKLKL